MSTMLTVREEIYASRLCRLSFALSFLRLPLYNLMIVTGQECRATTISVLIAYEVIKATYQAFLQKKMKYFISKVALTMEITQSVFLSSFLILCLILRPIPFNELVGDSYQDAGIWIIIASCGSEYILLLIYIGVTTHEYCKERKIRNTYEKRMGEILHPFIIFDWRRQTPSLGDATGEVPQVMDCNPRRMRIQFKESLVFRALKSSELEDP